MPAGGAAGPAKNMAFQAGVALGDALSLRRLLTRRGLSRHIWRHQPPILVADNGPKHVANKALWAPLGRAGTGSPIGVVVIHQMKTAYFTGNPAYSISA